MTSESIASAQIARPLQRINFATAAAALAVTVSFVAVFALPMATLARDWWTNPDAGQGLLLFPLALWLAWRRGLDGRSRPAAGWGLAILVLAILVRYASGLAAEPFTMRWSMVLAGAGLVVYYRGWRQLLAWWLPFALLALSIPLPAVVLGTISLPLQFMASQFGAWLLEARHVPVVVSGNIIRLPGHDLFVSEACSGLRSLTALLSLAVVIGGTTLRHPASRVLLIAAAIPIALLLNGLRVFVTGFLVFFIGPETGQGFMHVTEGWLMFLSALAALGALAWILWMAESRPERVHA